MSEEERNEYRRLAVERVRERYSWDAVTAEYERLFRKLSPGAALAPGRRVGVDN
jgi:glycosyltransferase involved in cell wall biosynthesis